jgi:hypothetical protein
MGLENDINKILLDIYFYEELWETGTNMELDFFFKGKHGIDIYV